MINLLQGYEVNGLDSTKFSNLLLLEAYDLFSQRSLYTRTVLRHFTKTSTRPLLIYHDEPFDIKSSISLSL